MNTSTAERAEPDQLDPITLGPGDFNLGAALVREHVTRPAGARLIETDGAVDHLAIMGAPDEVEVVDCKNLGRLGSDNHDAYLHVLRIDGETIRVLQWNVWEGHDPETLRATLDALIVRFKPDQISLQEVSYRAAELIEGLADRLRYWVQHTAVPGESGSLVMVRREQGRHLLDRGVLSMWRAWTGPKHGLRKKPRRCPRIRWRLASGRVVRSASLHGPTGGLTHKGGANYPAVLEFVTRVSRWLSR